jgi:lipoprotein-anchoring transpeptidase ErfK/SrfK
MLRLLRPPLAAAAVLFIASGPVVSVPASARETVSFNGEAPGTIIVRQSERRLYYVLGGGRAIRYPVGVGRAGQQWSGRTFINAKHLSPAWAPPAVVRRDKPRLPHYIPGGSPRNPLGVAALTLSGGDYAIHGTNRPGSIGGFVSYGCIRMHNRDIIDLFGRVGIGTPVVVVR